MPARCLHCPRPGAITARVAAIAQPVEHIIRNDGVGGSNPSCGTTLQTLMLCMKRKVVGQFLNLALVSTW
jgi:hypothetical protein